METFSGRCRPVVINSAAKMRDQKTCSLQVKKGRECSLGRDHPGGGAGWALRAVGGSCWSRHEFPRLTVGVISPQLFHAGLVSSLSAALWKQLSPGATKHPGRRRINKPSVLLKDTSPIPGLPGRKGFPHSCVVQVGAGGRAGLSWEETTH